MTTIHESLSRHKRRIARVVLALFVMAWANLVMQAPAHAAMKMSHEIPCHCEHTLCDTVLGMQDQADDGLTGVGPSMADMPVLVQLIPVVVSPATDQQFQLAQLVFRQTSPPPLTRTGILRI